MRRQHRGAELFRRLEEQHQARRDRQDQIRELGGLEPLEDPFPRALETAQRNTFYDPPISPLTPRRNYITLRDVGRVQMNPSAEIFAIDEDILEFKKSDIHHSINKGIVEMSNRWEETLTNFWSGNEFKLDMYRVMHGPIETNEDYAKALLKKNE